MFYGRNQSKILLKIDKLMTIPKKEKNKIPVLQLVLEMLKEKSLEFTEKELNEAIRIFIQIIL